MMKAWAGFWKRYALAVWLIGFSLAPWIAAQDNETAGTTLKTDINLKRDVLPTTVAGALEYDKILNVLRFSEETDNVVPLFVMVNPSLLVPDAQGKTEKESKLETLIQSWAEKDEARLHEKVVKILSTWEEEKSVIYRALEDVALGYFSAFFKHQNVQLVDNMANMIKDRTYEVYRELAVACIDARCKSKKEADSSHIEVELSLRLWRIEIAREEFPSPILKMEMLFGDQAVGVAGIPDPGEDDDISGLTGRVKDSFKAAAIDALKDKIALSLWKNPRMLSVPRRGPEAGGTGKKFLSWLYDWRDQIVGPSLSDVQASGQKPIN